MEFNYNREELIKEINKDLANIKVEDKNEFLSDIFNIKNIEELLKDSSIHEYILFDNIKILAKKLSNLYNGFPDNENKSPVKELNFYLGEIKSYNFIEDRNLVIRIVAKFQKAIKGKRKAHGNNVGAYIDFPKILNDDIEEIDRKTLKKFLEDISKTYSNISESKEWNFIREKILELEKNAKNSEIANSSKNLEISNDMPKYLMHLFTKSLSLKEQYSSEIRERNLSGDRVFKIFLLCLYNKLNSENLWESTGKTKVEFFPIETLNKIIIFCFKYNINKLQENFGEIQPYIVELISFAQKVNPNILNIGGMFV